MIPSPYVLILLALAAYRLFRLISEDTILYSLRLRVIRHERIVEFVSCPWCLGAWIAVAWWAAWWAWPHAITVAAVPFALSTVVGVGAMTVNRIADDD